MKGEISYMKSTHLHGTNLMISTIALGTSTMGTHIDVALSEKILDTYITNGGLFLDTANIYGRFSPPGEPAAELVIGKWMERHHLRSKLTLSTKGGARDFRTLAVRLSPEVIRSDLENSLKNLRTDYVDLYYLHKDNPAYPVSELMETMHALHEEGKFRYFGLSNWSEARMREALNYSKEHQLTCFSVNEVMMHLAHMNETALKDADQRFATPDICDFHKETQLPMTAYSAPAFGVFNRYYHEDFESNPRYTRARDMCLNDVTRSRIEKVYQLSKLSGASVTSIVLGYLYAQPFQVIPIIGPNSIATLEDNLQNSDYVLSQAELEFLI
jgi:aryl-alcohol dehydrogenase-like predicted oxidoreductase